jgi:hypothetical protein
MLSNIKMFYASRDIDLQNILQSLKSTKRASMFASEHQEQAGWQLVFVIFAAFFIDHSQNEFLRTYFTNQVTKDVIKLKYTLEIV